MPLLTVTVVEAIAIGVLALLFWTVWLRAREPGTPLLGAGFALADGLDGLGQEVSDMSVGESGDDVGYGGRHELPPDIPQIAEFG